MSELERRIQEAGRGLSPPIGPADTERELARLHGTERKRSQRKAIALSTAAGLTIVALAYFYAPRPRPSAPVVAAGPGERAVHFSDGSVAMLLSEHTVIHVGESRDDLLEIQLEVGKARFDVVPNPRRLFRVVTKNLRVEVLGTSFTVTEEDGKSSVAVHRGKVAAIAGEDRHELVAGMSFELDEVAAKAVPEEPAEELLAGEPAPDDELDRPAPKRRSKASATKKTGRKWRHLAEEGLFREAYDAMGQEQSPPEVDDVPGLMLAADVARLTGHPEEAVDYLRTVTSRHSHEPQAVLAAFTLGRIFERELSRPADAAEAYETSRRLGPSGSLAEDALAHEVDCWAKAKQPSKSKERAELYLSTYPEGRRAARMRSMIGKE